MEVGQILMQMSTGTASAVNAPASAEMAVLPAGEPADGVFAGMLRVMSQPNSGVAAVDAEKAAIGMMVASDPSGDAIVPKPAEVNTDLVTALLAAIGTQDHMPNVVVAAAEAKPEKSAESAKPDEMMPQDVALLAAGSQIVLPAGVNGRMPESGQKVEAQAKPEKSVESAKRDEMMPQDVALLAAGSQIVLSAGGNGRMPESGQKVEPQVKPEKSVESAQLDVLMPHVDRNVVQRSGRLAENLTMSGAAENGHSRMVMPTQGQPAELPQMAAGSKADPVFNGEATKGKVAAAFFSEVAATEGGVKIPDKVMSVDSSTAGAKMETAELSSQKTVETKSPKLALATAVNGMAANEMPADQAGRSQEVHPAQADANEQLELPADVRVVKASATVHPDPAAVVLEAAGRKTEGQEDVAPVQLDTATIKKTVAELSTDLTKVSSSSATEKELLNEGGKDASDRGMNNQFHQTSAHQQAKADMGTSLGSTSGAGQKDVLYSNMSENVFRQVKEVLVNREVKTGNEQITVRLSPEHLGELTLNLKMENQQLKVEIVTANRGVRDALMQHAENLKESLSRQNITMESFDVATNGGQRGFGQNDNGWKQLAQQQFMAGTSSGGYRYRTPEVDVPAVPRYGMQKQYAMVDVHY